ncbi:Rpn family recombination-promoting nuclease/putative transposase [Oceanobacillus caeni]
MESSLFVLERKPPYIDHDRLFKELIQTFFQEFIEAFFPEEYSYINFSTARFLEQEIFTDIIKGERRRIDILAEVNFKGEDKILLIHIEPQSYYQQEFHERMFIYYSRLYEKHRKPILPIAIFSYNDRKEVPEQLTVKFPSLSVLEFRYLKLHLINKNWRQFIHKDNPAAAALLSKMGYTEEERVQVKLEFLRMVSRMELNPAKMELIYGFFETYLKLNDKEEEQMNKEVSKLPKEEADRILELPNSYIEKGIEIGIKEGIEKEREQVVHNMLKKGLSLELIAEVSGLSIDKVVKIKDNLDGEI